MGEIRCRQRIYTIDMKKTKSIKYLIACMLITISVGWLLYNNIGILYEKYGGDYSIKLNNGYSIVRLYSEMHVLVDSNQRVIVHANIERFAQNDLIITGYAKKAYLPQEQSTTDITGYFILLLNNGDLKMGLDKERWHTELEQNNSASLVSLRKPTRP